MNSQGLIEDLSPDCARAREAHGLFLVDEPRDPSADAHARRCDACARAFVRMEKVWSAAGHAIPRLGAAVDASIADKALAAATLPAPALVLPFRARVVPAPVSATASAQTRGFAMGLALAAGLAALAILGPRLLIPTDTTPIAETTPVPAPLGPPSVTLAAAKGDVTHVPADGSVLASPKPGDVLPPGLFAATGGAALSIEGAGLLAVRGDATVLIGGKAGAPELSVARGEIFVDLPKGTIRTFVVHTPNGAVHVTGTQFDVKVKKDGTQVEVTRGSVIVKGPNGERSVEAGQSALVSPAKGIPVDGLVSDPAADPLGWVRELAPDRAPAAPIAMLTPKKAIDAPADAAASEVVTELHVAGLPALVVENAMEKREASLRYCYEQALKKAPEMVVRAALRFRVDGDGRAEDIRIAGIPVGQEKLSACLIQAAQAAVFPPTAPGTEVTVTYPLVLEPLDEKDAPRR